MAARTTKLYEHLDKTDYGLVRVWLELHSDGVEPPYYVLCGEIRVAGLTLAQKSVMLYPQGVAREGLERLRAARDEIDRGQG